MVALWEQVIIQQVTAVPLTHSFVFASTGFWLGLLICVILQATFYIIVIFKLNWKTITEEVCYWSLTVSGFISAASAAETFL